MIYRPFLQAAREDGCFWSPVIDAALANAVCGWIKEKQRRAARTADSEGSGPLLRENGRFQGRSNQMLLGYRQNPGGRGGRIQPMKADGTVLMAVS